MKFDSEDARQEYNDLLRIVGGPTSEEVADAVQRCGLTDGIPTVYGPADDRRERWKTELRVFADAGNLDVDQLADAAMAVADAELRGQRENLESAEAEIREQDAELARLREAVKEGDAAGARLYASMSDEADRLRAELEAVDEVAMRLRAELDEVHHDASDYCARAAKAEGTIERVRKLALVMETSGSDFIAEQVRAALEGDSA